MEKKNKKLFLILLPSLLVLSNSLYAFTFWKGKEEQKSDSSLNGGAKKMEAVTSTSAKPLASVDSSKAVKSKNQFEAPKIIVVPPKTTQKVVPTKMIALDEEKAEQKAENNEKKSEQLEKKQQELQQKGEKKLEELQEKGAKKTEEFQKKAEEWKQKNEKKLEQLQQKGEKKSEELQKKADELKQKSEKKSEELQKKSEEMKEKVTPTGTKAKVTVKPAIMKETETMQENSVPSDKQIQLSPQQKTAPAVKESAPKKNVEGVLPNQGKKEDVSPKIECPVSPEEQKKIEEPPYLPYDERSGNGEVPSTIEPAKLVPSNEPASGKKTAHIPPVPDILNAPVPSPIPVKQVTSVELPSSSCQPIILLLSVDQIGQATAEISKKEAALAEDQSSKIKPIIIPIHIQLSSGEAKVVAPKEK